MLLHWRTLCLGMVWRQRDLTKYWYFQYYINHNHVILPSIWSHSDYITQRRLFRQRTYLRIRLPLRFSRSCSPIATHASF